MKTINFVQPESGLILWTPSSSSLFSQSQSSESKYFSSRVKNILPVAASVAAVVLVWTSMTLVNRTVNAQVSDLEDAHRSFNGLQFKLKKFKSQSEEKKKHIESFSALFTSSVPASSFVHNMQSSIPSDVNLKSVSIDANRFHLCAYSTTYERIEVLIDLIKKMPAIDSPSVRFSRISADPSAQGSPDTCTSLSSNKPVSASIHGRLLPLTLQEREGFYKDSNDLGLFSKIQIFNGLLENMRVQP